MPATVLAAYLEEIHRVHSTRAGTNEISYYPALAGALNTVGAGLKPRVFAVSNLSNRGAGFPDMGLFTHNRGRPPEDWNGGQPPERGVVEIDDIPTDIQIKLNSKQVREKYLPAYGLVLVTNYRDFVLLGQDGGIRERFTFDCPTADAFFALAASTRRPAGLAARFAEFLERVLLHAAALARPEDVAFFLASYARDARARVEEKASLPAFASLREALENALGLKFEDTKGEHLFRSTLVQTLFYGLFSAWVEVAREGKPFDWHAAGWSLHVPFVDTLFQRIATPEYLKPVGLEEPLTWAAAALNRVDRAAFFQRFDDADAVRYFYEPFLAAYDPELRKALGVWYTPREIVKYMVERVDQVLRAELGIADGLADESVWVLDPCCGTGAYLVEVLSRIARTLRARGEDALLAEDLKQAATTRIAGFEIMPAPYVIAHWQIGHALRAAGAPLNTGERAAIYLTNALTGWAPPSEAEASEHQSQQGLRYTFPPLENERAEAARVKREERILVLIGNPPYNGFSGAPSIEEVGLIEPYRRGLRENWKIKKDGLKNEIYVRFLRIAERRIAQQTGRGVICFITNHSWISYPSFVLVRERFINHFDNIWIDELHGDRKSSERGPDGRTSETIFAIDGFSPGIKQGTAIALLSKSSESTSIATVRYCNTANASNAKLRRQQLLDYLDVSDQTRYKMVLPDKQNRYVLSLTINSEISSNNSQIYLSWPSLIELAETSPLCGVIEKRRGALLSFDRDTLATRMRRYLDPSTGFSELVTENCGPVSNMAGFNAADARERLLRLEGYKDTALRRIMLLPFDVRWAYHTNIRPIWNSPRPELIAKAFEGNAFIVTRLRGRRTDEGFPVAYSKIIPGDHLLDPNAHALPILVASDKGNISLAARSWLEGLGYVDVDNVNGDASLVWLHVLAIAYAPGWSSANASMIAESWPRIPLPNTADLLRASAALGARVAALLDPNTPVPAVTSGEIDFILRTIAVASKRGGGQFTEADRNLTAGWGHYGKGDAVMPGRGTITHRDYADSESEAATASDRLGPKTNDIFLNADAYWRNIPDTVWNFTIGGYQVLKKWLSYRERPILGRPMNPAEIREVTNIARRLAALCLMAPDLDANYKACAAAHTPLPSANPRNPNLEPNPSETM